MENLWPIFEKKEEETPKSIISNQVEYFNDLKLGLRATLSSKSDFIGDPSSDEPNAITHYFRIQASGLDGFTFTLFKATHKVFSYYPLRIQSHLDGKAYEVKDSDVFKKVLKTIFNSKEAKEAIQNLYSQTH